MAMMRHHGLPLIGQEGRCGCTFMAVIIIVVVAFVVLLGNRSPFAERVVATINTEFGNVCQASLKGFFEKTLRVDWTDKTVRLHALLILEKIDSVKTQLSVDGVRYFEFPNNAGTYNVVDWKTGRKWSNEEYARYYFK